MASIISPVGSKGMKPAHFLFKHYLTDNSTDINTDTDTDTHIDKDTDSDIDTDTGINNETDISQADLDDFKNSVTRYLWAVACRSKCDPYLSFTILLSPFPQNNLSIISSSSPLDVMIIPCILFSSSISFYKCRIIKISAEHSP